VLLVCDGTRYAAKRDAALSHPVSYDLSNSGFLYGRGECIVSIHRLFRGNNHKGHLSE
jgi:hypothetical protein